jgi:hypothetical protein
MTKRNTRYIVMTSSAKVPSSWKWHAAYRRVAVVETNLKEGEPKFIGDHARGVIRIVETWERCHVGKTERDEFSRAYRDAEALAEKLNVKAREARKAKRLAAKQRREAKNAPTVIAETNPDQCSTLEQSSPA